MFELRLIPPLIDLGPLVKFPRALAFLAATSFIKKIVNQRLDVINYFDLGIWVFGTPISYKVSGMVGGRGVSKGPFAS
ncbi:hypothetical protein E4T56_gene8690 [Termitomyces sp. T112]|nr:hypothetical protein E4T56_gene8690 [Termitomyces sp. T112]